MRTKMVSVLFIAGFGGLAAAGPRAPASKGRLGFAALPISPELRAHFGAPEDRGVLVDRVVPDSPAAHAGIAIGDVVTEVDGDPATSARDVIAALSDRKKGDDVAIAAVRNGKHVELHAKLEADPPAADAYFVPDNDDSIRKMFDDIRRQMREMELQQQPRGPVLH